MTYELRRLELKDLNQFIEIRLLSLKLHPESFGSSFEEGVDRATTLKNFQEFSDSKFTLGCFAGEKLCGICTFIRGVKIKEKHRGAIYGMFVHPDHRGLGLGRKLIETAIVEARKIEDLRQLDISVTSGSQAAQGLYERVGFKQWGRMPNSLFVNGKYLDEIFLSIWFD